MKGLKMAKKEETKEVMLKTENALALAPELNESWDSIEDVESKDIRIPRILLMQSTSELVGEGKAAPGDFINSSTGEKVGDKQNPIKIVPIYSYKTWVVNHKVGNKYEYLRTDVYTPGVDRPREESIGDQQIQNMETINLLCMLESELDNPQAIPYLLSFRSTSLTCGKDILTQKMNAINMNVPFPRFVLQISSVFTKNDKGQYHVMKFTGKSENTKFAEVAPVLKKWFDTFKAGQVKVSEEVVEQEVTPTTNTSAAERF